jgi:N-methylhydantoinase A
VIPHSASVHGAFGLITSDIAHEDQITRPMHAPVDVPGVAGLFAELAERVTSQLREEGFSDEQIRLQRSIDMRYRRQVHILTVPVEDEGPITEQSIERTVALFERLYEEKYGRESAYREAGIELVSFRLRGTGSVRKPEVHAEEIGGEDASGAIEKRVTAWVDSKEKMQDVPGYDFERLTPGNVIEGPAVIWSPITTLVVRPAQVARLDGFRNLLIAPAGAAPADAGALAAAHVA